MPIRHSPPVINDPGVEQDRGPLHEEAGVLIDGDKGKSGTQLSAEYAAQSPPDPQTQPQLQIAPAESPVRPAIAVLKLDKPLPETLNAPAAFTTPNDTGSMSWSGPQNAGTPTPESAQSSSERNPTTGKPSIITINGIDFHHQSEAEFANLLTYYGIEWEYEPHQFPLQWHEGRTVEMFRPDFYLTEYDYYIELTTMRQALVRRKNRKLRLLRALYPEINIKLLYRRDYQRLLERFGMPPEDFDAERPKLNGANIVEDLAPQNKAAKGLDA